MKAKSILKGRRSVTYLYEWCTECNGTGDDAFMPVRECGVCEGRGTVRVTQAREKS